MNSRTVIHLSIATVVGGLALCWSGKVSLNSNHSFMSSAHAVIGRPLTPLSYAGVARRTTARAIATTPVVVAPVVVAPAPVVVAPRCVQAVDAYGRLYTRCY